MFAYVQKFFKRNQDEAHGAIPRRTPNRPLIPSDRILKLPDLRVGRSLLLDSNTSLSADKTERPARPFAFASISPSSHTLQFHSLEARPPVLTASTLAPSTFPSPSHVNFWDAGGYEAAVLAISFSAFKALTTVLQYRDQRQA